ncbi:MAG: YdcF family protein [Acidobacteriia bacterium]|nr:YdcF family protein [Terriglobia bacterium]
MRALHTRIMTQDSDPETGFLEQLGVARDRITIEAQSRNSAENATYCKRLIAPKPGERWLLITSAMHMSRAVGVFRQAGFPVEPYPVDYQFAGWRGLLTLPGSVLGALAATDTAAHEWLGLLAYWITGRIPVLFPGPAPARPAERFSRASLPRPGHASARPGWSCRCPRSGCRHRSRRGLPGESLVYRVRSLGRRGSWEGVPGGRRPWGQAKQRRIIILDKAKTRRIYCGVRRGCQWPLSPSFERIQRRYGACRSARSKPVSPYSPQPLATATVSPRAALPRPLRQPTGVGSLPRNWPALRASPHPPPARKPSAGRSTTFCLSGRS